jgi:hypothetical protein
MSNRALLDDATIAELCASFQPNSSLQQATAGMCGLTGMTAGGFAMPAALRIEGVFGPSGVASSTTMLRWLDEPDFVAGLGVSDKMRPQTAMAHPVGVSYNDRKSGLLSTFNITNSGSHSRLDDWPPPRIAEAPPGGRRKAKPGGGSTA